MHGNAESQALFAALVRDSAFQALVSDIVVEFGNARYQDVVDRYVAGDDVLPDVLSRIWRETTQISGIWDLAMYAQMLAVVRDVNRGLEPRTEDPGVARRPANRLGRRHQPRGRRHERLA